MYAHGDRPDPDDVLHAAWDAGMDPHRRVNPVNVQRMDGHRNLAYFFKQALREPTQKRFLNDNGGSLLNTTRGFWRLPGHPPAAGGYLGLLRQVRSTS